MMRLALAILDRIPPGKHLPDSTRADLRLICQIDRSLETAYLKGKKGISYATAVLKRNLFWIFALLFLVLLVSASFLGDLESIVEDQGSDSRDGRENGIGADDDNAGDGESDDDDTATMKKEEILFVAFMFVLFAPMLEFPVWTRVYSTISFSWTNLYPTPVSRRSMVFYRHMKMFSSRLAVYLVICLNITAFLGLAGGFSFPELCYFFVKLFTVTLAVNLLVVHVLLLGKDYTPKRKKWYAIRNFLGGVMVVMLFTIFCLFGIDVVIQEDNVSLDNLFSLPLLRGMTLFHFAAAKALIDYNSPLHSLAFVAAALPLAAFLWRVLYRVHLENESEGFRQPTYILQ